MMQHIAFIADHANITLADEESALPAGALMPGGGLALSLRTETSFLVFWARMAQRCFGLDDEGSDHTEGGGGPISFLPPELLGVIISRVHETAGSGVMVCGEVCRDWYLETLSAVTSLALNTSGADAIRGRNAQSMMMEVATRYCNLRELSLAGAKMLVENVLAGGGMGSWEPAFSALGRRCPHLQQLSLSHVFPPLRTEDCRALATHLRGLRSLHAVHCFERYVQPAFKGMNALETLILDHKELKILPPLSHLLALRHLNITGFWTSTIPYLDRSTAFETLSLTGFSWQNGTFPITESFTRLRVLKFENHGFTSHWLPLLPALRELRIESRYYVDFSHNTQLTLLHLSGSFSWLHILRLNQDLGTGVSRFSNVVHLGLTVYDPRDLDVLHSFPKLARVDLGISVFRNHYFNALPQPLAAPQPPEPGPGTPPPPPLPPLDLEFTLRANTDEPIDLRALAVAQPTRIRSVGANLRCLGGFSDLSTVRHLALESCNTLPIAALDTLSPALTHLAFQSCKLELPPTPDATAALVELHCREILGLRLPPLDHLTALRSLTLMKCCVLHSLPPLPARLELLRVSHNYALRCVAAIAGLAVLERCDASYCSALGALPPLGELTALRSLDLSWCPQLADAPQLGDLPQLRLLNISGCRLLNHARGLSLKSLRRHMRVVYCT